MIRLALGIPKEENGDSSKCSMYAVNFTNVMERGIETADPNWPRAPCKHGWEFDLNEIRYSTISTEVSC